MSLATLHIIIGIYLFIMEARGDMFIKPVNGTGLDTQESNMSSLSVNWTREIEWKDTSIVTVYVRCTNQSDAGYWVTTASHDVNVVTVIGQSSIYVDCMLYRDVNTSMPTENTSLGGINTTHKSQFTILANFLGHTYLDICVSPDHNNVSEEWLETNDTSMLTPPPYKGQYDVTVVNKETILSKIFIIVVATMMVLLNFGFGCRIQVDVLKSILKRPLAPALGLSCQFIVMPLLGFGLSKVLPFPSAMGFGLFVSAVAPGGGGSNVWTVLLDGDLDLSMTMTLFSKSVALLTMPTWMFCLSRTYVTDRKIMVPYMQLFTGLVSLAVPCFLGIILKKCKSGMADKISKAIKPVSVLFILWVIIVGSITNTYVYIIMATQWYVIMGGCLLPYLGMLLGFIIAKLACQPFNRVIAICVETGIQDTGLAILLLLASFVKPLGSLAATMPITCALFTPLPLCVCALALTAYKRCCKKSAEEQDEDSIQKAEVDEVVKVTYSAVKEEDVAKLKEANNHGTPKRMIRGGCRLASKNYKTRL